MLSSKRAAEIPWDETALIVWSALIPKPDDVLVRQLREHAAAGRTILFLPPESPDNGRIFGLGWTRWEGGGSAKPQTVEWWRSDADLLANTRDGAALPVGMLEVSRRCGIAGEGIALARVAGRDALLMRSLERGGDVYFFGTLPSPGASSLARDGVVMFAMLPRALEKGAATLGKAQQRFASATALGSNSGRWRAIGRGGEQMLPTDLPLRAGVVSSGDLLVALNRPPGEDRLLTLSPAGLNDLFTGLDFRVLTGTLENTRSLTNEIWRTFLMAAALALVGEALLCMPPRRTLSRTGREAGIAA